MAPTEILAEQHLNTFIIFKNYEIHTRLLTSKINKKDKQSILNDLSIGKIDLVIGTHAIIQSQ